MGQYLRQKFSRPRRPGRREEFSLAASSTILPASMKTPGRQRAWRSPFRATRRPSSCPRGKLVHDLKNLVDHFRVERRCRLVEQHGLGDRARAHRRNSDALLLTAGQVDRHRDAFIFQSDTREKLLSAFVRLPHASAAGRESAPARRCRAPTYADRAQNAGTPCRCVIATGQIGAWHPPRCLPPDASGLRELKSIDAFDQRTFAGARRDRRPRPLRRGSPSCCSHVEADVLP